MDTSVSDNQASHLWWFIWIGPSKIDFLQSIFLVSYYVILSQEVMILYYIILLCWVVILLNLSIARHSKWAYPPCDWQHQDMACLRLFYFFLCCIPKSNFPSSDALYFQIPTDSCTGPLQRSYSVWLTVEFPFFCIKCETWSYFLSLLLCSFPYNYLTFFP